MEEETLRGDITIPSDDLLDISDHESTTERQVSDLENEVSSSDEVTTQQQPENESPNTIEEETSRDSSSDEERAADQSIVESTTEEQEETTTETTEHEITEKTEAEDEQSTSGEESKEEENNSTTENHEESTPVDQSHQDEENEVEGRSASPSDEDQASDTPAPSVCGGQITSAKGELQSPNFPDWYEPNLNCIWLLTVPDGSRVLLKLDSFETEEGGECDYDYLEVREGHSEDGNLIGKFCGYTATEDIQSTSNKLFVKFVSDSGTEKAGFSASFTEIPGSSVSIDNEIVISSESTESEVVTSASVMSEAASSEDPITTAASEAESEKTEVDSDESFMAGREERGEGEEEEEKSQPSVQSYEESTSVKSATADEENEVISESVSDEDDVPVIRREEKSDTSSHAVPQVTQTTMIETSEQSISDPGTDDATQETVITEGEVNNEHESLELTTSDLSTPVTPCEVYDCGPGFRSVCDGTDECVDIDECAQGNKCLPGRLCYNTVGSFICIPRENISDEKCFSDSDCSLGSECLNISRSFKCVQMEKRQECSHIHECQEGYICQDNECVKLFCGENGTLEMSASGVSTCQCRSGFKLNSFTVCVDIDECAEHEDLCIEGKCINTVPGYTCECEAGFKTFDGSCTDIDECSDGSHSCQLDEDCFNEPGTYRCESAQSQLMLSNGQQSTSSSTVLSSLNVSLTAICVILNFTLHLIKL